MLEQRCSLGRWLERQHAAVEPPAAGSIAVVVVVAAATGVVAVACSTAAATAAAPVGAINISAVQIFIEINKTPYASLVSQQVLPAHVAPSAVLPEPTAPTVVGAVAVAAAAAVGDNMQPTPSVYTARGGTKI